MNFLFLSLLAGLISGICWLIGDILLVGFDVEDRHHNFMQTTIIEDKGVAALMLSGSNQRLRLGALLANFSVPLMLFSLYGLYLLSNRGMLAGISIGVLAVAFAISPVAHVAFYYIGTASKCLFADFEAGREPSKNEQELVNEYVKFQKIVWIAAVGLTAVGWLGYTVLIFLGHTAFPSFFGVLTPLVLSPVAGVLTMKYKLGKPYLNGAGLNVGLTIFFVAAIFYYAVTLG